MTFRIYASVTLRSPPSESYIKIVAKTKDCGTREWVHYYAMLSFKLPQRSSEDLVALYWHWLCRAHRVQEIPQSLAS